MASRTSLSTSTEDNKSTDTDIRKLYSLSLSNLKQYCGHDGHVFKPAPFTTKWIYGYNTRAPVINLNNKGSTIAFYAACNCAVLYNWTLNSMTILQGHKHMVTNLAVDSSSRWLVTADSGPDNVLIIWDSTDNFPQRTLFNPHGFRKIDKVAISGDAKYLLTLAFHGIAYVYWWIWSEGRDTPHATYELEMPNESVVSMAFNPHHSEQFIIMARHDIWVGICKKIFVMEHGVLTETKDYELKIHMPKKIVHYDVGKFTCFTCVKATCQTLVVTTKGSVLIYGYTMQYQTSTDYTNVEKLKFIKALKIQQSCINVIKMVDDIVATGNDKGQIHFYDDQMKLLYWVHGFTVDNVKGLSFNRSPRSYKIFDVDSKKLCPCWEQVSLETDPVSGQLAQKLIKKQLPDSATTSGRPFLVRDFIIVTADQGILFCDFVTETYTTIMNYRPWHATALALHPQKPLFCTGFKNGSIDLMDFLEHKVVRRLSLPDTFKTVILPSDDSSCADIEVIYPKLIITCLKYSPTGVHLACGLDNGQLLFLDPCTADIHTRKPFKDTKYPIRIITYSPDSNVLAMADDGMTVCVYKYDCATHMWSLVGKHRSHYKQITALMFLPRHNPDGEWKLLSLGKDRVIVEYDIGKSGDEQLELLEMNRVDQTAAPVCGVPWPTPPQVDPDTCRTDLPLIFIANDEFKYKIVNYDTIETLATILGPRYENPVCRVQLVQRNEEDSTPSTRPYLLFTTNKLIGLQQLPIDGNPWRHTAMLGHPNQLIEIAWVDEYKTLLTIGQKDSCICQWSANYQLVDDTAVRGGTELDPYYCLVENGRPGWLFQEVRDLFYYIQILCQGTFTPQDRQVGDYIPIDSLPDLMRALGFFPSEYQVANMLREAKYKVYLKEPITELNFEEFVKLYINHRPALGADVRKIVFAYKILAERNGNYKLNRDEFINVLCEYGEQMTREQAWYLLSILSGHSFEDRAQMTPEDFSFMPEEISFSTIMSQILGVHDDCCDNTSVYSTATNWSTDDEGSID